MIDQTKRQEFPRRALYVLATPIGNLSDASERLRACLECLDILYCEDTRQAQKLLQALAIRARPKLIRLDLQTEAGSLEEAVASIRAGKRVGITSDAGTPCVSDPGARLVRAVREAGELVMGVAGPSALTYAIMVSGLSAKTWVFRGFFPRQGGSDREAEWAWVTSLGEGSYGIVYFESPERVAETMQWFSEHAPATQVFVGKEFTKMHETSFLGLPEAWAHSRFENTRGEWVIALEWHVEHGAPERQASDPAIGLAVACLQDAGMRPSQIAAIVGKRSGSGRREIYSRLKDKKSREGD